MAKKHSRVSVTVTTRYYSSKDSRRVTNKVVQRYDSTSRGGTRTQYARALNSEGRTRSISHGSSGLAGLISYVTKNGANND